MLQNNEIYHWSNCWPWFFPITPHGIHVLLIVLRLHNKNDCVVVREYVFRQVAAQSTWWPLLVGWLYKIAFRYSTYACHLFLQRMLFNLASNGYDKTCNNYQHLILISISEKNPHGTNQSSLDWYVLCVGIKKISLIILIDIVVFITVTAICFFTEK